MTLLDCVGLGINGIIGTGIFLLPAKVFGHAGGLSWAAWIAIGSVCLLVGLCFCEAAGRAERKVNTCIAAGTGLQRRKGTRAGYLKYKIMSPIIADFLLRCWGLLPVRGSDAGFP